MTDLEKLKEIFLTDVDEETKQENLETITNWEKSLIQHENFQSWQEHDITREIAQQARKSYIDASSLLATHSLTPRHSSQPHEI